MACLSQDTVLDLRASTDTLRYSMDEDGRLVLSTVPGDDAGEPASLQIGTITQPTQPLTLNWTVDQVSPGIAFGLSFNGSVGVYGPNLSNLYYVSDGEIVVNGVKYATVPQVGVGDIVSLLFDPMYGTAHFYLNGTRVA